MNFKKLVYTLLQNILSTNNEIDIESLIEVPANPEMGDYSFPCFKLAKLYRKAPNLIAEDLVKQLPDTEEFESINYLQNK